METKLFLLVAIFITTIGETCAAVRPAPNSPEKGSWAFYSRENTSKVAPEPALTEEAVTEKSESTNTNSQRRNAIVPEPVKKSSSLDSTDSETSVESESERHIRVNEILRYYQTIADEILGSHYMPKVVKRPSLSWTKAHLEEKKMTEQYNQCSKRSVTNRLITCTSECKKNAFELFAGLGKERELEDLCRRRCTNSGKLFIAETAEQIENYNQKQQRR